MENNNLSFDKFVHEAHDYFNFLAEELGHPEEKQRTTMIWKAVMHTVAERGEGISALKIR